MIEQIIGLKSTRASEVIKMMLDNDVIEPVPGMNNGTGMMTARMHKHEIGKILPICMKNIYNKFIFFT